eukprot:scaffold8531_cov62-Phaeocystis_antarctica.AAC.1
MVGGRWAHLRAPAEPRSAAPRRWLFSAASAFQPMRRYHAIQTTFFVPCVPPALTAKTYSPRSLPHAV